MIAKDYNPYDIYENEDVKKHLQRIANKINLETFSVKNLIINNVFSSLTGVTNFLGVGFAKHYEFDKTTHLQQFQREQIVYLEKHPENLGRELRINLIVSILYLKNIFAIKEKMNNVELAAKIAWESIKKISIQKGLNEATEWLGEKHWNEKWQVLKAPIALLMNSYYLNKNISLICVDSYLSDLISAGENTSDIDNLCRYEFKRVLTGTVKNYLENQFEKLVAHSKANRKAFPQLNDMMESCMILKDLQVRDLQEEELRDYEFYRNEIEQWGKNYPAKENTDNYKLVVNVVQNCTKVQKQNLKLDTNLIKDLKLNQKQREQICEKFYKKKNFMIHSIYMEKFKTIAEIVSFWNAFDNSDPLNMTP